MGLFVIYSLCYSHYLYVIITFSFTCISLILSCLFSHFYGRAKFLAPISIYISLSSPFLPLLPPMYSSITISYLSFAMPLPLLPFLRSMTVLQSLVGCYFMVSSFGILALSTSPHRTARKL
uniref:Uncharacterized protein n=1 Tax=Opuntia streptacantha TaxID=393608 RepID=A0A7C9CZG5_OPUST